MLSGGIFVVTPDLSKQHTMFTCNEQYNSRYGTSVWYLNRYTEYTLVFLPPEICQIRVSVWSSFKIRSGLGTVRSSLSEYRSLLHLKLHNLSSQLSFYWHDTRGKADQFRWRFQIWLMLILTVSTMMHEKKVASNLQLYCMHDARKAALLFVYTTALPLYVT